MPKYPKVNYIGNKEKISNWIIKEMPVKEGRVLDIFAGGCSVSYALKKAGYEVIANDILYADYTIAKAIIENNNICLKEDILNKNIEQEKIKAVAKKIGFLENRLYYKYEIEELARLIAISQTLKNYEKYLFLALLRRAMIRKLPYSRMNIPWEQIQLLRDEEYSYKKYKRKRAYHNKSFEFHIRENIDSYNNAVFTSKNCKAYNEDAISFSKKLENIDVAYIDPPYPSTMNNYDSFYGLFDDMFGKRIRHTDFTNKNRFLDNLEKLIKVLSSKTKYIILSQNTKVKPEPEIIKGMLKKYGRVELKEIKHNYQLTGKKFKNSSKELLFIVEL